LNKFAIAQPATFEQASKASVDKLYSLPVIKAGGVDVLDHLKEGLMEPDLLVNVRRLRYNELGPAGAVNPPIRFEGKQILLDANATLADIAMSNITLGQSPVLAQAAANAATPAVRNVASVAGNLLQRPRCWYYRNNQFACLKKGGNMCFAVEGENKFHAIFGPGPCHIVHPSNLAPALMAMDATVHVVGSKRTSLPISELFHMPDKGILSEHNLEPGEVVTHVTFDVAPTSGFYAIKEKQSFDWPCVFACVKLTMSGGTIAAARVVAGAVAPVPWELAAVAEKLKGLSKADEAGIAAAAELAVQGARPMTGNAYKVAMLKVCVKRAVTIALGGQVPSFSEIRR
jgi:xanthine dehydrogenase YagS FAD-binding subunit